MGRQGEHVGEQEGGAVGEEDAASESAQGSWWRLAALFAVMGGLYGLGHALGLTQGLTLEGIEAQVQAAGPLGWLVFCVIFVALNQLHVPGMFFLAAGFWLFGPWYGALVGWVSALIALALNFALTRGVGGTPLSQSQRPWLKRWVERLKQRPILTLTLLRVILIMAPVANIAVILAGVRFRDYMIGSALGLALLLGAVALGYDWMEPWLRAQVGVAR